MASKRKSRDLNRSKAKKEPYEVILIVCEDKKTEPLYFNNLRKVEDLSSVNISIISGDGTDPISVVDTAIEKLEEQKKYLAFDKVYCVIDRDKHHHFEQAINKAKEHNIDLIISYPSFEYWYICHFVLSRSPIEQTGNKSAGDNCVHILNQYWKTEFGQAYSKNLNNPYELLLSKLGIAINNAQQVLKQANSENNFNPSTQVHELVDKLRKLKR
ncbi:RloB family protein [Pelistega ratti]|uniref:RloB family protein n=1 Tax=Pelistega ratti TaxID=2652177 RepID=UPI0013571914|nr:RloB family protein [Pelistega ratti]